MGRKKRYIKGNVYLINDQLLVKHNKPNRRVVATNNDKNNVWLKRITSIDNCGRNALKGIPIEKYPQIRKASVVENKTFKRTLRGKPIKEKQLRKTKTRLNKWDRKKIGIK